MVGAIRTWDIVSHPLVTVQCFGWLTLLRAVLAGKKQTFLSLLTDSAVICPADAEAAAVLNQCIDLELRAEHVYLTLAGATIEEPALALFFTTLAEQEQNHADLLRLCAAASKRNEWWLKVLRSWRDDVIRLGRQMTEAEALVSEVADVDDAMRLVVRIEMSEINHIFLAAMSASDSAFVRKLLPFQKAVDSHIAYISEQLPRLAPNLCCEDDEDEQCCNCVAECGAM
jgi:rubrerythrin